MGSPEIAPRFWVPLSLRPSPPRFLPDLVPCLYLPGHPRKTWILAPYALSSPSHVDMHSWSLYIPTRLSSPVYPQQPVYIPAAIRRRYLLVDSRSLRLPARDPSQIDWILGPYASTRPRRSGFLSLQSSQIPSSWVPCLYAHSPPRFWVPCRYAPSQRNTISIFQISKPFI